MPAKNVISVWGLVANDLLAGGTNAPSFLSYFTQEVKLEGRKSFSKNGIVCASSTS